jgi:ribulose-5-phosphate 4-epimerase/fuculose-1-phosphate aldolase
MCNPEKKMVLQAAQQMAAKGLGVATSGNVSVHLGEHGDRELLLSRLTGATTTHCTLMV